MVANLRKKKIHHVKFTSFFSGQQITSAAATDPIEAPATQATESQISSRLNTHCSIGDPESKMLERNPT
uniref:Uncharacterized protein n=1 Tax=Romanomermis culicivorax TaxID=13658 RepID=A0A915JFK5_ROMCU